MSLPLGTPPSTPGNQRIRQEQKRGCFTKANSKYFCFLFFFSTQVGGQAGLGSGRHRDCGGCSRVRHAGPAQGACAGRGAGGRRRPRSLAPAGLRGNGLAGGGAGRTGRGGCYFCRFLFLAATSPWQRCYSPRPLPGSAGARDPGRPRPLVSHLLCSRSPHGVLPLRHGAPSRAPRFPLLPAPPRPAGARGRGAREGGRLMGDAY